MSRSDDGIKKHFLGENQMFTIPPHIGMMSSLKELYINDNPDLQVIFIRRVAWFEIFLP